MFLDPKFQLQMHCQGDQTMYLSMIMITNIVILPEEKSINLIDTELQEKITSSNKYGTTSLAALQDLLKQKLDMVDK